MKRSELIAFVSWLDEGTRYYGKEYLQRKTDEWLGFNRSGNCKHPMRKYITNETYICFQCGETLKDE